MPGGASAPPVAARTDNHRGNARSDWGRGRRCCEGA